MSPFNSCRTSVMAPNKPQAFWLISYLCAAALLLCMLTSQTEAKVSRVRRQDCLWETYEHEGRSCCRCPAGQKVKQHCTALSQTQCELCEGKEFQSHANSEITCEPCGSCTQENVNQEVDRHCTPYMDTICKCKANHYCSSGKTPCKICEPCHVCGPEGIKVACSATNNTICNDKPQDNSLGIALGIVIPVLIAVGIAGWFFWKKRKSGRKHTPNGQVESSEVQIPLQPKVTKLGPHIPEVAEVIGWSAMKNVAIQSEIPDGIIESCESKNNGVENTIALLRVFEEKVGHSASSKLIQSLEKNNQNIKAEKVLEILRDFSSS